MKDTKINVPATGRCPTPPTFPILLFTMHSVYVLECVWATVFTWDAKEHIIGSADWKNRTFSAPVWCIIDSGQRRTLSVLLCKWRSPSTLSFQGSFPGNLQLVLVLRPTTLLQRTLSDILFKFNKDEFKMKVPVRTVSLASGNTVSVTCVFPSVVFKFNPIKQRRIQYNIYKMLVAMELFQVIMLSSITELHSYIDRTQLTQELGGTQEYCHEKWISHRTVCAHYTPCG